ncbi:MULTISPECIES: PilN domain-containing protein [unclassified Flavobacterium]|uniref:PilN domain-containing protein n=1 Tax=unclassified Flavobacterium TaxID=196869 RepID=UPI001F1291CF|nr:MULTISPECIES: hypothetical protein [unclassified Flavobacterium]UMY66262.1 hypothetical protein MKO97_02460 [Flavobacterium sp. HJ-32-4]
MSAVWENITSIRQLRVIGLYRDDDNNEYWNVLTVKRKGKSLVITDAVSFDDLETLDKATDKKTPVVIVLEGKGILFKQTTATDPVDAAWLRSLAFDTIYFSAWEHRENSYLFFCRRSLADRYLDLLRDRKFEILDVYVGSITSLLLLNGQPGASLFAGDYRLQISSDFTPVVERHYPVDKAVLYAVGDWSLNPLQTSLFASAAHFFVPVEALTKSNGQWADIEEVKYKRLFSVVGVAVLLGFFVLLAISYGLMQYYNSRNAELSLKMVYYNQSFEDIKDMERKIEEKQAILNGTGFSSTHFLSFYLSELAQTCPADIQFTDLGVQPVEKEIKSAEKILTQVGTIILKGSVYDQTSFNTWIKSVRSRSWIDRVEIKSLKKDKKGATLFELDISVKNV